MGERINVAVRVIPRSKTDRVDGARAGRLLLRVAASPESGAANRAVQKLLASALGMRAAEIHVEQGATSRDKTLSVPAAARAALLAMSAEAAAAGGTAAGPAHEVRVPQGPRATARARSRTGKGAPRERAQSGDRTRGAGPPISGG